MFSFLKTHGSGEMGEDFICAHLSFMQVMWGMRVSALFSVYIRPGEDSTSEIGMRISDIDMTPDCSSVH